MLNKYIQKLKKRKSDIEEKSMESFLVVPSKLVKHTVYILYSVPN